ncbi:MAG: hypothetical protein WB493_16750 [Anaeromyxobacteraceae bacterium]
MPATRVPVAPVLLAVLGVACAGSVPIARDEAARLSGAAPIPVLWVRTPAPWVDCPADEGKKTWEMPGSAREGSAPPIEFAAAPGGTWDTIQDEWTRTLQVPPVDPAAATAERLVARARASSTPIALADPEVAPATPDPAALSSRFGAGPVLVVRSPRFVLVGCYFTYRPWFTARAVLVRPSSGEVLWRETCGGTYPDGDAPPASRDDLEAWGRSLYASILAERADACGARLLGSLAGEAAGARDARDTH